MKIDDKVLSGLIRQVGTYGGDNKTLRVSAAAWGFIRQEIDRIEAQEALDKYKVEVKDED